MQVVMHFLRIRADPLSQVHAEGFDGFRKQADRLEEIVCNHRHEYVQLKIALGCSKCNRSVISHDLNSHHSDLFALGRVYFSRHDG